MATNMENNNITIINLSTSTKELNNLEEEKEAKYLISLLDKTNFRQKSLELDITDLKRQIVEEDDSDED